MSHSKCCAVQVLKFPPNLLPCKFSIELLTQLAKALNLSNGKLAVDMQITVIKDNWH